MRYRDKSEIFHVALHLTENFGIEAHLKLTDIYQESCSHCVNSNIGRFSLWFHSRVATVYRENLVDILRWRKNRKRRAGWVGRACGKVEKESSRNLLKRIKVRCLYSRGLPRCRYVPASLWSRRLKKVADLCELENFINFLSRNVLLRWSARCSWRPDEGKG